MAKGVRSTGPAAAADEFRFGDAREVEMRGLEGLQKVYPLSLSPASLVV